MGSLESYKQHQKEGEIFFKQTRNKELTDSPYGETAYTREEYEEVLKQRSDESMLTTQRGYFFLDRNIHQSKMDRYRKMAEDENGDVEKFSRTHKNRSAKKRKKSARAAAAAYEKAFKLQQNVSFRTMTPAHQFSHESEIMKYHLQGRIEAAKAKATSKENEAYRIAKANYSCTSALMNQLNDLLKKDPENAVLLSQREKLEKQLEKAKKDFAKNTPTSQKKWLDSQGFDNKKAIKDELKKNKKINAGYNEEDTRLKMKYEYFMENQMDYIRKTMVEGKGKYEVKHGDEDRILRSMTFSTYLDKNGKPLTKADAEKEKFNKKWIDLCMEDSREKLEQAKKEGKPADEIKKLADQVEQNDYEREKIILERFRVFMNTPMPTPEEFEQKGPVKLFEENPAIFYECNKISLTTDNLRAREPFLQKYLDEHEEVRERLDAWSNLASGLLRQLSDEHMIRQSSKSVNEETTKEKTDIEIYTTLYREQYDKIQKRKNAEDAAENEYNEKIKAGEKAKMPAHMQKKEREEQERSDRDEYFRIKKKRREYAEGKLKTLSFEQVREKNPNITEEAYEMYLKAKDYNLVVIDPEFEASVKRARKNQPGKEFTLSRLYAPVLKEVKYDGNFEPADEEAMQAYEWNKKWCNAVETNDTKTQDEMVLEQLPKVYDGFDIELPDPADLEAFAENMLKNNLKDFILLSGKTLAMDNLTHYNDAAKKYMKERPELDAWADALGLLFNYVEFYSNKKYGIDIHSGGSGIRVLSEGERESENHAMMGATFAYTEKYQAYKSLLKNKG